MGNKKAGFQYFFILSEGSYMHHSPIKYYFKIMAYFSYKNFSSKFKLKSYAISLKSDGVIV